MPDFRSVSPFSGNPVTFPANPVTLPGNPVTRSANPDDFLPAEREERRDRTQPLPAAAFFRDSVDRLLRNRAAVLGLLTAAVLTVLSAALPALWPASTGFLLTTARGIRATLAAGFLSSLSALVVGGAAGAFAGLCGGKANLFLARMEGLFLALPDLPMLILLTLALNAALPSVLEGTALEPLGSGTVSLALAYGAVYWAALSRQVRERILSLGGREYVLASRAAGGRGGWIVRKHLLPGWASAALMDAVPLFSGAVAAESFLSFLGLGVSAPFPSLGSLAVEALDSAASAPARLAVPAAVLFLLLLSLRLLGSGLRDAFDPERRK